MEFDTLILKKGFREWFYTQNTEEICESVLCSKLFALCLCCNVLHHKVVSLLIQ